MANSKEGKTMTQRPRFKLSKADQRMIDQLTGKTTPESIKKSRPRTKGLQERTSAAPAAATAQPDEVRHVTEQTAQQLHAILKSRGFAPSGRSPGESLEHLRCAGAGVTFLTKSKYVEVGLYGVTPTDIRAIRAAWQNHPIGQWVFTPVHYAERIAKSLQVEHTEPPAPELPEGLPVSGWIGAWWIDTRLPITVLVDMFKYHAFFERRAPIGFEQAFTFGNATVALARIGERWQLAVGADGDYRALTAPGGTFATLEVPGRPGTPLWGYLRPVAQKG
jgi:hypothetical protein